MTKQPPANSIPRIVNKGAVALFFGVSVETVTTWVTKRGAPVLSKTGTSGQAWEFDLLELCEWKFTGASKNAPLTDPDKMIPQDRKAWYESETKRRALQEKDRELIPAADVERVISTTFAALASDIRAIPDMLERRHGVSGAVAAAVEEGLHEATNAMADRLIALADVDPVQSEIE